MATCVTMRSGKKTDQATSKTERRISGNCILKQRKSENSEKNGAQNAESLSGVTSVVKLKVKAKRKSS